MKRNFTTFILIIILPLQISFAKTIVEIPSSFNPVGSGARAIGMGGAFIGVADDATAASWNPGGLTQLLLPEMSFVGTFTNRKESLDVKIYPEASDQFRISNSDITYFSMAYPFNAGDRNMIIAITYQQLYDMNRHWTFQYYVIDDDFNMDYYVDYHQKGSLSALGLSYCIEITPDFSLGFTVNIWDNDMSDNHWTQIYDHSILDHGDIDEDPTLIEYQKIETYSFNGTNFNVGFLWNINSNFTLGAVLKTSFWADIDHTIHRDNDPSNNINQHEKIKMPLSYGMGIVYRFSDNLYVSGDMYKTHWDQLSHVDAYGIESNPTSEKEFYTHMDATHQFRIGAEYLFANPYKHQIFAIRSGIFYDPMPSMEHPDDYYGFSLGLGFTKNEWFSCDIAYQCRWARQVGEDMLEYFRLSQNIIEHKMYFSTILYMF